MPIGQEKSEIYLVNSSTPATILGINRLGSLLFGVSLVATEPIKRFLRMSRRGDQKWE
jgi:hypothetical protein